MTTVFVVERGVYAERYIAGIYSSPEAAMAAHPVDDQDRTRYPNAGWREEREGDWSNGCDYGSLVGVTAYEVDPAGTA